MNFVFFPRRSSYKGGDLHFHTMGGQKENIYASAVRLEEPTVSFSEDYMKSAVNNFYNGCMTLISPSLISCVWRDDAECS